MARFEKEVIWPFQFRGVTLDLDDKPSAVAQLLKKEEGVSEKKMLYLRVSFDSCYRWFTVDAHGGRNRVTIVSSGLPEWTETVEEIAGKKTDGRGFAVRESNLYVVGGKSGNRCFFDAFVMDMNPPYTHHILPSMKSARARPVVVAVQDGVYVFGGLPNPDRMRLYGECYHIPSKEWRYLPQPPKGFVHPIDAHAVHECENQIIFLSQTAIHSFSFRTHDWMSLPMPTIPYPVRCWSQGVAVVGDVLFWHSHDYICAYNITTFEFSVMYTFNKWHYEKHVDRDGNPSPTFLLNVGNGRLCLVWFEDSLGGRIGCSKFRSYFVPNWKNRHLVFDGLAYFSCKGRGIQTILQGSHMQMSESLEYGFAGSGSV